MAKNNVVSIQERRRKSAGSRPGQIGSDLDWAPESRELSVFEQMEAERCANEVSVILRESPGMSFDEAFTKASAPAEDLGPEDPPIPMAPKEIREKVFARFAARPPPPLKREAARPAPSVDRAVPVTEVESAALLDLHAEMSGLSEMPRREGAIDPAIQVTEAVLPDDPFRPKVIEILSKDGPMALREVLGHFPDDQRAEASRAVKRLQNSKVVLSSGWATNARLRLASEKATPAPGTPFRARPKRSDAPAAVETGPPRKEDLPEAMRPLAVEAAQLEEESDRLRARAQKLRSMIADYVGLPGG